MMKALEEITTPEECDAEIARLRDLQDICVGSLYPAIIETDIIFLKGYRDFLVRQDELQPIKDELLRRIDALA